jgi:hypothetical protein
MCTLIGPNKCKSLGAKSGLYRGWFTISQPTVAFAAFVKFAIYGRTFSYSKTIFFESFQGRLPNRLVHIIAKQVL